MSIISNFIYDFTLSGKLSIIAFLFFGIILFYSSIKLIKYADIIITKTKFGGAFIGGVLIAAVTSMPELITEITQSVEGNPGAGISDDIGSNAFSALLIGIGALFFFKNKILRNLDKWTKISFFISGGLSFAMIIFLLIGKDVHIGVPGKFVIGLIPALFFAFYLYSLRLSYKYGDTDEVSENGLSEKDEKITVKKSVIWFTIWAIIIVLFSILLNTSAVAMMKGYGIGTSSIGGIFLAVTTSLPEVVAFFVFLKKKQPRAAIAALIGSHIFNIGIQFFGDISYTGDSTYNVAEVQNIWPIALIAGLMTISFGIYTIIEKKIKNKFIHIAIIIFIILIYLVGWLILFLI